MDEACIGCGAPRRSAHHNTKLCQPCADARLRRPASKFTDEQRTWLREHEGRVTLDAAAETLGVSKAAVSRARREMQISLRRTTYSPDVIETVLACYEEFGGPATREAFPGVSVRGIVERHAHAPRHGAWTDNQMLLAAAMIGFVPFDQQARLLERPKASSIRAFWVKRMGITNMGHMHGLSQYETRDFVRPEVPTICAPCMFRRSSTNRPSPRRAPRLSRHVILWADMPPYLLPGLPAFMVDAIYAMGEFQRWLFGGDDVHERVLDMMRITGF